jgi:glycolate oxidase iron-sulfur subunit
MTILEVERPAEPAYLNCIRCGLCLAVCPTYNAHLNEIASPRGRVMLARKSLDGEMELTPNLMEQMNACLACMACDDICPVGIRPAELALSMRHIQEQIRPARWKQPLFGGLISHVERMELATLPLRLYQRLGIRSLATRLRLTRVLPRQLRDMEAMLPRLPQRPLLHSLPEITPAQGESRYRVGFFLGCAQNVLFAGESAATARVLARNGCTVITPRETRCCGMPMRGYGRVDLVLENARHNIALFEQASVDFVVTDCATCGSTLKELQPSAPRHGTSASSWPRFRSRSRAGGSRGP